MSEVKINLIVAFDLARNIGYQGDMPWGKTMKADLKRFKELTYGKAVVMGRKTYESIGRPLPDRLNIVMTRDVKYDPPELRVPFKMPGKMYSKWEEETGTLDLVSDLEDVMYQTVSITSEQAVTTASLFKYDELFVIGGAEIYQEFMPYADKIYVTKIHELFDGDVKFPSLVGEWDIAYSPKTLREGDKYPTEYITYTRRG